MRWILAVTLAAMLTGCAAPQKAPEKTKPPKQEQKKDEPTGVSYGPTQLAYESNAYLPRTPASQYIHKV